MQAKGTCEPGFTRTGARTLIKAKGHGRGSLAPGARRIFIILLYKQPPGRL